MPLPFMESIQCIRIDYLHLSTTNRSQACKGLKQAWERGYHPSWSKCHPPPSFCSSYCIGLKRNTIRAPPTPNYDHGHEIDTSLQLLLLENIHPRISTLLQINRLLDHSSEQSNAHCITGFLVLKSHGDRPCDKDWQEERFQAKDILQLWSSVCIVGGRCKKNA